VNTNSKSNNRKSSSRTSSRKRSSSQSKSAFKEKKKKKLGIWVFVGITALIVAAAGLYKMEQRRQSESEVVQIPHEKSFADVLASGDFEELKSNYDSLDSTNKQAAPIRIENMSQQIELAKRAAAIAKGDEEIEWAQLAQLRSLVLLESLAMDADLGPTKYHSEMHDVTTKLMDSDIVPVARRSLVAKLIAQVIDYLRADDASSFAELKSGFNEVLRRYPDDYDIATSIQRTSLMFRSYPQHQKAELALLRLNGEHYSTRKDRKLVQLGEKLLTEAIVFEYGLRDAENSFVTDPINAADNISGTLDKILTEEKQLSATTIARLSGACNVLELYQELDLAMAYCQKIMPLADSIANSELRKNVTMLLDSVMVRCSAIGNPLTFDEVAIDGTAIRSSDFPNRPILICFLPGNSKRLNETLDYINRLRNLLLGEIEFVMIAVRGNRADLAELAKFANISDQLIVDVDLESQLFKQFPVRLRPSFLLLDSDRIMKKKVADIRDLNRHIQQLLSEENR
jgi:hypothetical protein